MGEAIIRTAAANAAHDYVNSLLQGQRDVSNAALSHLGNSFLKRLEATTSVVDGFTRGTASAILRHARGYKLVFEKTDADHCLDFDRANCLLRVNRNFVDGGLLRAVRSPEFRAVLLESASGSAVRTALRAFARAGVDMLVAHEVFHSAQGLESIDVVRRAARTVGWPEVGKFDVDADFRAAAVEAALNAIEFGDTSYAGVLTHFEDALAYQLRYNAPIFGCPPGKPHKRARVAGKVMQLARVIVANRTGRRIGEVEYRLLTMPLYMTVDATYSEFALMSIDPIMFVGSCALEPGDLKAFYDRLDSGDVDWLTTEAITLAARMGFVAA